MSNKPNSINDAQTAYFLTGVELSDEQINVINKLSFDEIIKLKSLFGKVYAQERKTGRKKKVINASFEEIEALHDAGMTYINIAQKYNVSLSKLSKWLRSNRTN